MGKAKEIAAVAEPEDRLGAEVKKQKAEKKAAKVKQTEFLDNRAVQHKAVDDAAEIYYTAMQERVTLTLREKEAKRNLTDKMIAHNLTRYEYEGKIVELLTKNNVKVRLKHDESANNEINPDGFDEDSDDLEE